MPAEIFDNACERLKAEGFRLTATRKKLVKAILNFKGHWTIQDLAEKTQKQVPGVGVATIYRTVHLLARLKFLTETKAASDSARYEVAPTVHHDHLTCVKCREIFEFHNDAIENLQTEVARRLGFELVDHRMELYGDCQRRNCPYLKSSGSRVLTQAQR